jgi:hypothetical protein
VGGLTFFSGLLILFTLLLFFSRRLMQAAAELISSGVDRDAQRSLDAGRPDAGVISQPLQLQGERRVHLSISDNRTRTTGELVAPPSVTENTTNLLEND